jgi:hypothetical protein
MRVRGQIVTAPAGKDRIIRTLSIPAIKTVMDLYGVENQRECMERVMNLFHHFQGLDDEG